MRGRLLQASCFGCLLFLSLSASGADVSVTLQSDPPGAKVYIDNSGDSKGTTPCIVTLPEGNHVVKFDLQGYNLGQKTFSATGTDVTVVCKLTARPASLTVESNPSKASVLIDGTEAGITPLREHLLEPGTHELRVQMDGYETVKKTIVVSAGQYVPYKFTLKKGAAAPVAPDSVPNAPDAVAPPTDTRTGSETNQDVKEPSIPGEPPKTIKVDCWVCSGKGVLQSMGCPKCKARGKAGSDNCSFCSGTGRIPLTCPGCKGRPLPSKPGEKAPVCKLCNGKGGPVCLLCKGTGKLEKSNPEAAKGPTQTCPFCNGTGLEMHAKCIVCQDGTLTTSDSKFFIRFPCFHCKGTCEGPPACKTCYGKGYVGDDLKAVYCPQCLGTGIVGTPCSACKGKGWIPAPKQNK
jgi:hypothetical protein